MSMIDNQRAKLTVNGLNGLASGVIITGVVAAACILASSKPRLGPHPR